MGGEQVQRGERVRTLSPSGYRGGHLSCEDFGRRWRLYTSPQTYIAHCQGATEHNTALSITHVLKCMARTCCLHAALQASAGKVFPLEINQINLTLQRGRRGPKEPPCPVQCRQSQTLSLQCPPHNAEPRRWSCSNADLPYHLVTFLPQTPSYFPQAASPVREGRGEQPPVITAWLILHLLHQTLMLRSSLRSASCPTGHLQANSLAPCFAKSPHFSVILCCT